jgi:hypothetical protein
VQSDPRAELAAAVCSGFDVIASDGVVGRVERLLFPVDETTPDFLVIRVGSRLRPRHPVLPAALVDRIDVVERRILVSRTSAEISSLPEHLPVAI